MRWTIFFLCFLYSLSILQAQQVQWASELLDFSTQYKDKSYSAKQVVGRPNALPALGISPVAWAPARAGSRAPEFVKVRFAKPMQVRQIAIGENFNPGAISKIILFDTNGNKFVVYESESNHPIFSPGRMFRKLIEMTDYKVEALRLELNTREFPEISQIDAIGISDGDIPIQAEINEIAYENYEAFPENLGMMVNSRADDMLPIISPDGRTLYFARKKHPQNFGDDKADDIWVSYLNDHGQWSPAINVGEPLNNKYHNYVCAVSPDGNTLFLANQYNRFGIPGEGVSMSRKKGNEWSNPENLIIKNFYNKRDQEFSHYHMSMNGQVLLMAIEREDSHGDMDLYVSFKLPDNTWSEPKNLGPTLNTAGKEGSVFLAADNRTIYFSSEGFSGYGSFDMYITRRLDDTWQNWTEPVNLGEKINSRLRDVYYTIPASGDYVYFSSDKNSYGGADLYRIKLPAEIRPLPVALLKGKVIDALTNQPIEADIKYVAKSSGNIIGESGADDGKFQVVLPYEEDYRLETNIPGYYPENNAVDLAHEVDEEMLMDYDEEDEVEPIKRDIISELKSEILEKLPKKQDKLETANKKEISSEVENKLDEKLKAQPAIQLTPEERENLQKELEETVADKVDEAIKEPEYQEMEKDIRMIPVKEGQIIRIDNIYFTANKAFLRPESDAELDKVVEFMNTNPGIFIEVRGHTNGLPSHEFCNELSNDRAENVTKYLIRKGITPDRITYKGYGKTLPIADNSTLAGRKQNQRVEIKILKVD